SRIPLRLQKRQRRRRKKSSAWKRMRLEWPRRHTFYRGDTEVAGKIKRYIGASAVIHLIMDKIRIGIVGTGFIGKVHRRIYARDEGTEIAALYDIIPERAEMTSKSIGGKVCSSREELLDNCDAVLVCAPNKTHREIASAAVDAGKHVFCEKPFSIGIE